MLEDVPSPIDLRLPTDARAWEASAMSKRPWRVEFFAVFASALAESPVSVHRVLELGSGPGFLAEHLLRELSDISYVALDFSASMHDLAVKRLGPHASRVQFVERSFRDPSWVIGLGHFDAVVTNQAVHELRHKRHASSLHGRVKSILVPGGPYLVCDHFAGVGGMKNEQLYMSVAEQRSALVGAGFTTVQLLLKGGLVLHYAT
jgi:SAM-dependent methyltransferase